jgi:hypothetical protein
VLCADGASRPLPEREAADEPEAVALAERAALVSDQRLRLGSPAPASPVGGPGAAVPPGLSPLTDLLGFMRVFLVNY